MAKSNAKLKAVEDAAPSPSRAPLAEALALVDEIQAQIAANDAAQTEARSKIIELEADIEERKRALEHAPALERRALRAGLADVEELLTDYRDHAAELDNAGLRGKLESARNEIHFARVALLKGHPHKVALLQRLAELRAETAQTLADLGALDAVGALEHGWTSNSTTSPPPSPALMTWIAALMVDADAELAL